MVLRATQYLAIGIATFALDSERVSHAQNA